MPGFEDTRTITGYRTASKFYRRPPGAAWLPALLAIPLLLALIGWAGPKKPDADANLTLPSVNPSATLTAPSVNPPDVNAPNVNAPEMNFAPLSILRNGKGFTLSGERHLRGSLRSGIGSGREGGRCAVGLRHRWDSGKSQRDKS